MRTSKRKRSKYNVDLSRLGKLARTCDGIVFDSKAERDYYAQLMLLLKTRTILGVDRQVKYELRVEGKLICKHIVDFVVIDRGGRSVHEVKGMETAVWRLKKKLFEALYPAVPYIVIKPVRSNPK